MSTNLSDVASTPDAAVIAAADSSPASTEISPASTEAVVGNVNAGESATQAQAQPVDIYEGIPSIDELAQQVEQKVPYSEGLLRLRSELERVKPELDSLSPYKSLVDLGKPEELQAAYDLRAKLFSPVVNKETNQPEYDGRGLQKRTSHPWLESMEAETPGFVPRHLNDLLSYQYKDPMTGQVDNLLRFHFKSLGLNPDRFDDYLNLDSLLAKTNGGAVTPDELSAIPEPDQPAYKTLPSSLRGAWKDIPEDEQRFHLDGAKERLENRQWREQQERDKTQAAETQKQQFESKLQQTILSDLSTVRKEGLTSLRDSLTRSLQLSGEQSVNEGYVDAIIAPLALLLSPDFSDLAAPMLERAGVKLDQNFSETLQSFVIARQEYKRAEAYGDSTSANLALKEANGKFAKIMAKFNDIALKNAATFGMHAKQIATTNGAVLAAATARAMPGNGSVVEKGNGQLPAGLDPYSPEANRHLWNQSQSRGQ